MAAALLGLATSFATGQNLIEDSSFEVSGAGATNPWVFTGQAGTTGSARTGSFSGYVMGPPASVAFGSVSQLVPTVAGQLYEVSFYLSSNFVENASIFASFGGGAGFSDNVVTGEFAGSYYHIVFQTHALLPQSEFVFGGEVAGGTFYIDDVTVTAVPEPETYALFIGGLGVIAALAQRRRFIASQGVFERREEPNKPRRQ